MRLAKTHRMTTMLENAGLPFESGRDPAKQNRRSRGRHGMSHSPMAAAARAGRNRNRMRSDSALDRRRVADTIAMAVWPVRDDARSAHRLVFCVVRGGGGRHQAWRRCRKRRCPAWREQWPLAPASRRRDIVRCRPEASDRLMRLRQLVIAAGESCLIVGHRETKALTKPGSSRNRRTSCSTMHNGRRTKAKR